MSTRGSFEARATRLAWRLSEATALDARSLALSRIALGVLVLVDLRERFALLHDFYTDDGFVTRETARRLWAELVPGAWPPWSLHLLSGTGTAETALFVAQAACAVALIAGYRSRLAAALACALLASLCQRDVLVTGGDDWLLVALLFTFALGEVAFTAQLAMLLFFAGMQKVVSSGAWREGSALHQVLQDAPATAFGHWLGAFPVVDCVLSYGSLAAELVGPWCFFLPASPRLRTAAVLYVGANLVGFAAALEVGRLPFIALAALLAQVPGDVWRRVGFEGRPRVASSAPGVVVAVVLAHAVALNVARLGKDVAAPRFLEAPAGVVVPRQGWGMFRKIGEGGVPQWYVVAGTRRGELAPSLRFPDRRPFTPGPESSVTALLGNQRWGYFWSHADMLASDHPDVLQRYLARRCDDYRDAPTIARMQIVWVHRRAGDLENDVIAARDCGNPASTGRRSTRRRSVE